MQEIIDLLALKTLHWFSYVANVCWIVLGIMPSAIFLTLKTANRDLTFVVAQMATRSN